MIPARPAAAEINFFKSFKGFEPRKNDTVDTAFARLAERNGWQADHAEYHKQLKALRAALVSAKKDMGPYPSLTNKEARFFKCFKGFTPRKTDTAETAFARLAQRDGWKVGSTEYNRHLKAMNDASKTVKKDPAHHAKLTEAEVRYFRSFKGFHPRKPDTCESAFARLAEREGWRRGSTQYCNQLEALHEACSPAQQRLRTAPVPTNGPAGSEKSIKGSDRFGAAIRDDTSSSRETDASAYNGHLSTLRPMSAESHGSSETFETTSNDTASDALSDSTTSADDPVPHLCGVPLTTGTIDNDTDEDSYGAGQAAFASSAEDESQGKGDQTYKDSINDLAANQVKESFNTSNLKLEILQSLCRSVSIVPVPDTIAGCKQVKILIVISW